MCFWVVCLAPLGSCKHSTLRARDGLEDAHASDKIPTFRRARWMCLNSMTRCGRLAQRPTPRRRLVMISQERYALWSSRMHDYSSPVSLADGPARCTRREPGRSEERAHRCECSKQEDNGMTYRRHVWTESPTERGHPIRSSPASFQHPISSQ